MKWLMLLALAGCLHRPTTTGMTGARERHWGPHAVESGTIALDAQQFDALVVVTAIRTRSCTADVIDHVTRVETVKYASETRDETTKFREVAFTHRWSCPQPVAVPIAITVASGEVLAATTDEFGRYFLLLADGQRAPSVRLR